MSFWKWSGLVLVLMLAMTSSGCCCCCSPDMLPTEFFTAGEFADVPAYPGATQQTGSDMTMGLATLPFRLITDDAEWKHYVTADSASNVLDWYTAQMAAGGWISASDIGGEDVPTENALIFARPDDPTTIVVIMIVPDPDGTQQHILIGHLHVSLED